MIFIAESSVDTAQAQQRAEWEATRRLAEGMSVEVSVQGWRQQNGILWGANQLHRVKSESLRINQDLLTLAVRRVQSIGTGTVTNLTFVRPDTFNPKPEISKADDPGIDFGSEFLK